jgi:hypothetical protein
MSWVDRIDNPTPDWSLVEAGCGNTRSNGEDT